MSEIQHYGVPGMKWGVRKAQSRRVEKASKKLGKTPKMDLKNPPKMDLKNPPKMDLKNPPKMDLKNRKGLNAKPMSRRKARKHDEKVAAFVLKYAKKNPRKKVYITQDGQTSVVKGRELTKYIMNTKGDIRYEDIGIVS